MLCFVTQWGVYRRVARQGYLASDDCYSLRFAQIAKEITRRRTIDDTIIWSANIEDNLNDFCNLLTVCAEGWTNFKQ